MDSILPQMAWKVKTSTSNPTLHVSRLSKQPNTVENLTDALVRECANLFSQIPLIHCEYLGGVYLTLFGQASLAVFHENVPWGLSAFEV